MSLTLASPPTQTEEKAAKRLAKFMEKWRFSPQERVKMAADKKNNVPRVDRGTHKDRAERFMDYFSTYYAGKLRMWAMAHRATILGCAFMIRPRNSSMPAAPPAAGTSLESPPLPTARQAATGLQLPAD
jgi:hypothetical protein